MPDALSFGVITVTVNGVEHALEARCSVAELVRRLDLGRSAYAVEVNRRLVPRRDHEAVEVEDGDRVEVVTLVGGG